MKDAEFLAEIKAREELEQRGFKRITCDFCKGTGVLKPGLQSQGREMSCYRCNGQGYNWEAPITK